MFLYGEDDETDADLVPDENEAFLMAWNYLKEYGITSDTVEYAEDVSADYGCEINLSPYQSEIGDATALFYFRVIPWLVAFFLLSLE